MFKTTNMQVYIYKLVYEGIINDLIETKHISFIDQRTNMDLYIKKLAYKAVNMIKVKRNKTFFV